LTKRSKSVPPEFFPHIDVISLIEAESGCPTPTSEKGWLVFKFYLDCLFRNRHWLAIAIDVSKKWLEKVYRKRTHNGLGKTGEAITMTLPPPPSLK